MLEQRAVHTLDHTIDVSGDTHVELPADGDFLSARFSRAGPDLLMETQSGDTYVIPAYFMSESPLDLITHDGAVLSADLVAALAGPVAPRQFAQLGQSTATEVGLGQPIGQVSEAEGTVTVTHPDGSQAALVTGDKVFQGDVLETATAANISIIFVDDTVFTLDEDGRMVMDEMVYDPDTQSGAFNTTVVQGVFSFVSGQVAKTSPDGMVVNTPTSTIGIRGSTVVGKAAAQGVENKITLIRDVDGNVGEIVISNVTGSLTLNSAGATTTVFSSTSSPTPIVILSPAQVQQAFGQNLTKLIQTVSKKAKQDAQRAEDKAQESQQEAQKAEDEAKQADADAKQAEDEAAQAEAEAEAAAAEAAAAKAEAEAAGDEIAIAKAAAAEAKAAEAAQKAAEAKAAAEAEAQVAAKAQAEAAAKASEAEVAQAKAEQAQKFSSLADTAFKAQTQAFEQNKQTEASKAEKAAKADTTASNDDAAKTDNDTDTKASDDAAAKAAADAATKAAAEAAAKAAAEAEAATKAAAEAAAKAAAEAAAKAAALAAAAAEAEADKPPKTTEETTVSTPSTTTNSYDYSTHATAVTVTITGTTGTITDTNGLDVSMSNIGSVTGTSYNDTYTLSGVTLDKLSVGSGTDTITLDSTTRITSLSNRPAHENTLQTLGTDGTSGDMDLRGTSISGDFLISLNTQGNYDNSTILKVDSSTSFTSGSTTITFGKNLNARNIESDDGVNLSGVNFSSADAVVLDSSSDTVGATLTVTSASTFSETAITGSGDDKIVFNDSGTFSFNTSLVTGISSITFNGTGTNSLQVNQADLASVTTLSGNTGTDTITTADSSLDLSAITLTSIDVITTTNVSRTTFKGSNGDDIITGGIGHDVLAGGLGSDTLTGGNGGDVFAYQTLSNQGVDNLVDYNLTQGDRIYIEKTVIGNKDTTFDAGEWYNLGTLADDASIQAAINAQSHVAGAIFGVFNSGTGHAEAWYDVTDHATTGDANKVAYLGAYSQAVANAASTPSQLGIILADTTDLSILNYA